MNQSLRTVLLPTALVAVCAAAPAALAEIASVGASGFDVRHEAAVAASPARVYRALTEEVGRWWHPDHTHSKNSRNLSIVPRPGGCFCEKLGNGGGAEHMRVVVAMPGRLLRLDGALGPLQEAGLTGSMTWDLTGSGSSTKVVLTYGVGGHMRGEFQKIAAAVDSVLGEQLKRLEAFVETGKPAGQ